ncbi:Major facilitator superfamily domain, general substrate transporter [Penicillium italicum]|uniref:Major facilitator superfamily domain, general substrate transporter n=1 Tax=Penicillium italicum TaxID=40296 RepID=A0A0A2KVH1_PENIT|nr:Major facilitator superfamily domain, general substrate transporter [Penicillium italicum]
MPEKPSIEADKALPTPLSNTATYVDFKGADDTEHPQNWSTSTKLFNSILVCSGTFIVSLTSAIFAPGIDKASKDLGVGTEVGTLGTTLYVLGFASGPLIWAPASELRGRKWPLTIAMLCGGIFTIASAVAQNIQTLIICRFFAGMFGASQLTVVPGVLADLYSNATRGAAISLYALTVFVGPFMAPFVGGFIASSYLGWRWTLYIPAIFSLGNGLSSVFFLDETYPPCILVAKAASIRKEAQNGNIRAIHEEVEVSIADLVEKYFTRPLKLLFTEPIILVVSVYMSFIYGLVYALLEAYPFVFEHVHGMTPAIAGLMFIGLIVGVMLACAFILFGQLAYAKKLADNQGIPVPEWRLAPPLLGAPVFTIGLFWFGWTGFTPWIHWAVPAASGIFIGFGVLCIFLPCFNYIVDAYLPM